MQGLESILSEILLSLPEISFLSTVFSMTTEILMWPWNYYSKNEHFKVHILCSSSCGHLLQLTLPKKNEANVFYRKQTQKWGENCVLLRTVLYLPIFCVLWSFSPFSSAVSNLFTKILKQTLNGNRSIPTEPHCQTRARGPQHSWGGSAAHSSGSSKLQFILTRDLISFSIPGPCHNGKISTLLFGIVQKSSKPMDQKVSFS